MRLVRLEHDNTAHKNNFILNWMLGNTCNYQCSYCPSYLHDGSIKWPKASDVIDFCQYIKNSIPEKQIVIEFTGGEVTLWEDLPTVLKQLHQLEIKSSILTNGTKSVRWWKEITPYLDRINLSFHPASANIGHFINVVNTVSTETNTHVNIIMDPAHFNKCMEMVTLLQPLQISIAKQPLIQNLKGPMYPYSKEQSEYIKQSIDTSLPNNQPTYRGKMKKIFDKGHTESIEAEKLISSYANSWNSWMCFAGVEQLVISSEGNIYRGWCMVNGKIGNIRDYKISLPKTPVYCDQPACHCTFDIMCTKWR